MPHAATAGTGSVPASAALSGDDVPVVALLAYRAAADVIALAAPACGLRWTLLAAVGRVESDHGRHAGAVLGNDGVSRPAIRGVALDGTGPVARIPDTDAGRLDGDRVWDRAVGPMQFLPSTWAVVGVDGDSDGIRSPHDLDDAALAAGVYLCSAGHDLREADGTRRALLTYNHSAAYAATVMRLEQRYRAGDLTVATGYVAVATAPAAFEKSPVWRPGHAQDRDRRDRDRDADSPGRAKDREPAAKPPPAPVGPVDPGEPEPVEEPAGEEPTGEPTDEPTPATVALTGVLELCEAGFCLDGRPLDVGTPEHLAAAALEDHDQDGALETSAEELAGLVGAVVELTAAADVEPLLVLAVGGRRYRDAATPEPGETLEPAPDPDEPAQDAVPAAD